MNAPASHPDPGHSAGDTKQSIEQQYHSFLIAVCTRAGFVPEQDNDELREVVEEYIGKRAFQAESPEEEEDNTLCPERPETCCTSCSTLLPHNKCPTLTSPDNQDQTGSCQEQA